MIKHNKLDFFGPLPESVVLGNASKKPERYFGYSTAFLSYFDGDLHGESGELANYIAYIPNGTIRECRNGYLYHYTKGENFKNIVKSKELWASKLGMMNDNEEIGYTKKTFIRHVLTLLQDKSHAPRIKILLNNSFDEHICSNTYVISFSRRANLLSQWVKYSGKDGVSIGLPKDLLTKACDGQNTWLLVDVEYSHEVHNSTLNSVANRLLKKDITKLTQSEFDDWFSRSCVKYLQKATCKFKNPGFREEEEVRLIINVKPGSNKLKDQRNEEKQYIPLKLLDLYHKATSVDTVFHKVISGPSNDYESKMKGIQKCLQDEELKFSLIIDSGIPYKWS